MASFGRYLLDRGVLAREQLAEATQVMVVFGGRLGTILVEAGMLSVEQVEEHLARHLDLPRAPRVDDVMGGLHPRREASRAAQLALAPLPRAMQRVEPRRRHGARAPATQSGHTQAARGAEAAGEEPLRRPDERVRRRAHPPWRALHRRR